MNQYTMMTKLGEGAFSTVYRVKRKEDGREYAMKKMRIMNLSEKEVANCLNEVRILASINDPHILAYKDSFFDELTNTFCIVTECLEGGDVFKLITKYKQKKVLIDEAAIWRVAQQSLRGLRSLHDMNVLHRDIKSANIFFTRDQRGVKLADMNVSIVTSTGMARTQTGTPYYASPEVWMEKPYSAKCDIWSLGCVLYEMAAQKPPFTSHDLKSLKRTIISGVFKRIPSGYSADLDNFIRLCLRVDPKDRLSAGALLEHDLMKKRFASMDENTIDQSLSGSSSRRLLEKITAPRKREFRIIKDRLPKNRFETSASTKILDNNSCCEYKEKDKENMHNFVNSTKVTKKDQVPSIKWSSSLNHRHAGQRLRQVEERVAVEERPPLPRRPLRA